MKVFIHTLAGQMTPTQFAEWVERGARYVCGEQCHIPTYFFLLPAGGILLAQFDGDFDARAKADFSAWAKEFAIENQACGVSFVAESWSKRVNEEDPDAEKWTSGKLRARDAADRFESLIILHETKTKKKLVSYRIDGERKLTDRLENEEFDAAFTVFPNPN